jgi:hypothetical protein
MAISSKSTLSSPNTLTRTLERLARIVPGISGYQDRETIRDNDKQVRTHLAEKIGQIKKAVYMITQSLTEKKTLTLIGPLDRFTRKLDRMRDTLTYAPYGYSGVFDLTRIDLNELDKLYSFDLSLLEQVETLYTEVLKLEKESGDERIIADRLKVLETHREHLEAKLTRRNSTTRLPQEEKKK